MDLKDAMSKEQYDAMIKEIAAEVLAYQELEEELERKSELFKRWRIKWPLIVNVAEIQFEIG